MAKWTVEQVLALAPDASSAKSGQDLANPRKWVTLGCGGDAVWGECQGSGKNPYQAQIDISEPAFKCSCPSRKFPCKHALGLFLIYVRDRRSVSEGNPPDWVSDWQSSRAKRAEQKAAKAEAQTQETVDPAAQAKRTASREAKVAAGLHELELWLCDLVRGGLAAAQTRPYDFWQSMAARMVDAQAPEVGRVIKGLAGTVSSGEGWQERLLRRLSRLHLLIEGHKRIDALPETVQADIRAMIGWTQNQDELLSSGGVRDMWLVAGQRVYEEDRLRVERTWLIGRECARSALVLDFSHLSQPAANTGLAPGACIDAEVVFFPSAYPLRALVKAQTEASTQPTRSYPSVDALAQAYSTALAANPWLPELPAMMDSVTPVRLGNGWFVRDSAGDALPIDPRYQLSWDLLSISGGHPITLFGEWDGEWLLPMSAWSGGRAYLLSDGAISR